MDTAPKTGRYVFVWTGRNVEIAKYEPERTFFDPNGKEQNWIKLPAWVVQWDRALDPGITHWMPLPTKSDKRWKPFNTAPKDGQDILCLDDGEVFIVNYVKDDEVFPDEDGTEEFFYWLDYADDRHNEASHWMPMPEKP